MYHFASAKGDEGSFVEEGCGLPHSPGKQCSVDEANSGQSESQFFAMASEGAPVIAPWISLMLNSQFFGPCEIHKHMKKNECTYFCATCSTAPQSSCQHCIHEHRGHQVVQIRRYVYCDVVRCVDINQHVDVEGIQAYIINQAKVVFLNARPQAKMGNPNDSDSCRNCARNLREGFAYCCLACKVQAIEKGQVQGSSASTQAATPQPASPPSSGPCCPATPRHPILKHQSSLLPCRSTSHRSHPAAAAAVDNSSSYGCYSQATARKVPGAGKQSADSMTQAFFSALALPQVSNDDGSSCEPEEAACGPQQYRQALQEHHHHPVQLGAQLKRRRSVPNRVSSKRVAIGMSSPTSAGPTTPRGLQLFKPAPCQPKLFIGGPTKENQVDYLMGGMLKGFRQEGGMARGYSTQLSGADTPAQLSLSKSGSDVEEGSQVVMDQLWQQYTYRRPANKRKQCQPQRSHDC